MTIKNTLLAIVGLILLTIPFVVPSVVTATDEGPPHPAVTDIEISTFSAHKTTYNVGELLDITDLVVVGSIDDGGPNPREVEITASNITGFDSSEPEVNQELTITVDEAKTTYTVTIEAAPDVTAPTILSITTKDTNNDGSVDTATVVFSENVLDSSFTASDFTIGGMFADTLDTGSSQDDDTVSVSVSAGVVGTEAKDVTYTLGSATDIAGNSLGAIVSGNIAEIDKAGPVPISATIVDSTTMKVVFSEEIHGSTNGTADFSVVGNKVTKTAKSDDTVILTLGTAVSAGDTPDVTIYGDGTGSIIPNGLKDMNGNWSPQEYTLTPDNEIIAPAILESIDIHTPADKLVYIVGETLNIDGLVVHGLNSNNMPLGPMTITTANITGFNSSIPAVDQVLTITVGVASTTYMVTIVPVPLGSIEIETPADKLIYIVGEDLDITGLVVHGSNSDEMPLGPMTINAGNITGFNSSIPATDQELTITVDGKTTTYTVTIMPVPLGSIEIETPADKLIYIVGEDLDITGLVVHGLNGDDMPLGPMTISPSDITGFNSSIPEVGQVLTITVGGKTATYTISIVAPTATASSAPASVGGGGGIFGSTSFNPVTPRPQTVYPDGTIIYHDEEDGTTSGTTYEDETQGEVLGAETFVFLKNLQYRDNNNDVKELQRRLRNEGFFTYPTDTGYFGPITYTSVRAYQTAHPSIGYVTGYVGPLTRGELNK